jgi:hypothetical protein
MSWENILKQWPKKIKWDGVDWELFEQNDAPMLNQNGKGQYTTTQYRGTPFTIAITLEQAMAFANQN